VFAHVVISEHYEEGRFSSRLEAEIADILWNCQPLEDPEEERHIPLTDEALAVLNNLNCIALIQGGQVLSLLDIEHTPTPMTTIQRAHLYHSAARTLLEAIAAILKDQDNRQ
jgi:hypothetical protein